MDYLQRAKDFKTKKRLGQNFLVDSNIIDTIIDSANLSSDDVVLEIGPGAGFVTENLAPRVKKIFAVELDSDAVDVLENLKIDNLEILMQDILKTNLSDFLDKKTKIIANIPYYITSPIIAHLLGEIVDTENTNRNLISEIYLMVQYEVAQRIVATPDSPNKQYGLLSILTNFWSKPELITKVPAKCFYPRPKVDSAIVKLTVNENPRVELKNPKLFQRLIKSAFAQRRKTFLNAVAQGGFEKAKSLEVLEKMGLSADIRGEKLSIEQFNEFTEIYSASER